MQSLSQTYINLNLSLHSQCSKKKKKKEISRTKLEMSFFLWIKMQKLVKFIVTTKWTMESSECKMVSRLEVFTSFYSFCFANKLDSIDFYLVNDFYRFTGAVHFNGAYESMVVECDSISKRAMAEIGTFSFHSTKSIISVIELARWAKKKNGYVFNIQWKSKVT